MSRRAAKSDEALAQNEIPGNVKGNEKREIYALLFQAVRAAALLHDIGHPPFSHIVEFALNNVYEEELQRPNSGNDRQNEFFSIMRRFYEDRDGIKKELHEEMGKDIADVILRSIICDISETAAQNQIIYDRQVYEILIKEIVHCILEDRDEFAFLHKLIDGTLDGDRLDYVTRDPINSGMDCGKIEYDRIIERMSIVKIENHFHFCPDIKSLNTVEDFLMRRWLMYKNIIFHHRVIKTDFLLQKSVEELSRLYVRGELACCNDIAEPSGRANRQSSDELLLPFDISGLWKAMKEGTVFDKGNAICQWDDSWLMTVLKFHYFSNFMLLDSTNPHYILSKQLEEILTNKKQYISLIKRMEDFKVIDDAFAEYVNAEGDQVRSLMNQLNTLSEDLGKCDHSSEQKVVPVEGYLSVINEILNRCSLFDSDENKQGFVLRYFIKQFKAIMGAQPYENIDEFTNEVMKAVRTDFFTSNVIGDILIIPKKFKVGTAEPVYFWDNDKQKVYNINNISSITSILNLNVDFVAPLYIYVLFKLEQSIPIEEKVLFLNKIGKASATVFINVTTKCLNTYITVFTDATKKIGGNDNV